MYKKYTPNSYIYVTIAWNLKYMCFCTYKQCENYEKPIQLYDTAFVRFCT